MQNSKQNGCGNIFVAGSLEDLEEHRYKPRNEYYVLRHGHSQKNGEAGASAIISSRLEHDKYHLTEKGKEQIKKIAKRLKKLHIDTIISSPFIRTKETAQIIADELGLKVTLEPEIREYDHGLACEGKTEHVCLVAHKDQRWETKTPDGESWKELRKRVSKALRKIDAKYEGKRILLVSHGDPIWLLETFTLGLNPDETIASRRKLYPKEGEFKKLNLKNWPYDDNGELDLHRPYIDRIELKCPKCGSKMVKIPDLIDVWFDSGAMPYAQWHWPFENQKIFKEQFPADFIVEGIDQMRGWFYTLLAIPTLLGKGPAYKNVMSLNLVLDEKGQKMSKSKGNIVSPFEVMDKFGADAARWYFYTVNSPGDYKLFSMKDVELRFKGFITTLDNCVRFYELYSGENSKFEYRNLKQIPNSKSETVSSFKNSDLDIVSNFDIYASNLLDKWILSRLNVLITEVTVSLDNYDPTSAARAIEKFVIEDFSNWWLRRSRKRKEALEFLRFLLLELAKIIAPFTPFIAENIYQRLNSKFKIRNSKFKIQEARHLIRLV
ncbi:MAG: class I tRNA ligase family protein, partial [Candidatus Paceibacteria bacterium]